jgi:hypothetical protein
MPSDTHIIPVLVDDAQKNARPQATLPSAHGIGGLVGSLSLLIRWAQRARSQAETPLIPLSRFAEPALTPLAVAAEITPVRSVHISSL